MIPYQSIVIVGSGLAGYTLAREIRQHNTLCSLTMIAYDRCVYYSKPTLSTALAQKKEPSQLVLTEAKQMAERLHLKIHGNTTVLSIDRAKKILKTDSGDIAYDALVLALGAEPSHPSSLSGNGVSSVLSVNDIDDYAKFRVALTKGKRALILGAGLVGCEFANDLAIAHHQVTVADPADWPLSGLLPKKAGESLINPLSALGISWRFGVVANQISKTNNSLEVIFNDHSKIVSDVILSATGLVPRTQLAQTANLGVARGIIVNCYGATKDSDIYALGDCAEYESGIKPFVMPITHAAKAMARTLTGKPSPIIFPHMPVHVKTTACPVVVIPVAKNTPGEWRGTVTDDGAELGFFGSEEKPIAFALTGKYVSKRSVWLEQLPPKNQALC